MVGLLPVLVLASADHGKNFVYVVVGDIVQLFRSLILDGVWYINKARGETDRLALRLRRCLEGGG